jgi:hypothetical protein
MIYNILIIGAGQLGSRHMQGVLRSINNINLYVLDPSEESLILAEQRAKEIHHNHTIHYLKNWDLIPKFFDIVIVSTNSNIREKVVYKLLTEYEVKYLILEKVLFQEIDSFRRIAKLIESCKVKVWVNHPRRLYNSYNKFINDNNLNLIKVYSVVGCEWGLACNGLHFLDLISYMSNSEIVEIDTSLLDNKIKQSKRNGFIEFSGTISGKLSNGSIFYISSFDGEIAAPRILLSCNNTTYEIQESGNSRIIEIETLTSPGITEIQKFKLDFQSDLTNIVIDDLIKTGECKLTNYKFAFRLHELFVKALLVKYNSLNKMNSKILPIT